MKGQFSLQGCFSEIDFPSLLFHVYQRSISGWLIYEQDRLLRQICIDNQRVISANSNSLQDSLANFLLKSGVINQDIRQKTESFMQQKGIKFGRALLEQGLVDNEKLWFYIKEHFREIVFSLFEVKYGRYDIKVNTGGDGGRIFLNEDILSIIISGIRRIQSIDFIKSRFENISELFINKKKPDWSGKLWLKEHEIHVLELVKDYQKLPKILQASELLEKDTLRFLYLFMVMQMITPYPVELVDSETAAHELQKRVNKNVFHSFEEALKYYNNKYEFIFRILSKEIGPIAVSMLQKAIDEISDNLPSFMQKIELSTDGRIVADSILKSIWYSDFDQNIGYFLRGLEEILYTQIFIVKKHLGVDGEQQVIKCLKGIGN